MQKPILLPLVFLLFTFAGCATSPSTGSLPAAPQGVPGVYHKVQRGQTLWRISKTYGVGLDELVRINRIPNIGSIETGQMLFIPNRQKPQDLPIKGSSDDFIWPLKGKVIAGFGATYRNMNNKGLNIKPFGNTNVYAARSGRIVFYSENFLGYGKTLIIEHGDGFSSVYARNRLVFVKAGENVQQGTLIAQVGSAGRDRDYYLHFEIRKGAVAHNPYYYLP